MRTLKRHPALYRFLRYEVYARLRSLNRDKVFLKIYQDNAWDGTASVSGPGSTSDSTHALREALPGVVKALGARSLLDIPCGDFEWMQHVPLDLKYIGGDLVQPLVEQNRKAFGDKGEFYQLDLLRDQLPAADIVFCRDCLVHLSFREINLALRNMRSAAPRYLMTTTFPGHEENADTVTPYWRALNMQRSPFNFPAPLELIKDYSDAQPDHQGKYLGVWRVADLEQLK